MSQPELPVPLSAVALRLADEVGQAVLDRVGAGDLASAADLDQHVAAVRAGLAACPADQPTPARLAGQTAARAEPPVTTRPHHARWPRRGSPVTAAADAACPDVPFTDNAWRADTAPALRPLLHYACGFVEAAVRADWWPVSSVATGPIAWQAMRLAAVCRLIRQAEASAALHPDLG